MGEANARGTKEERTDDAVEAQEVRDTAAENREHAPGLVWLAFESTNSIPILDGKDAFVMDEKTGALKYGPNDEAWTPLLPADVPEWLKQEGIIKELKDGVQLCANPGDGGRWYRGVICSPPGIDDEVVH